MLFNKQINNCLLCKYSTLVTYFQWFFCFGLYVIPVYLILAYFRFRDGTQKERSLAEFFGNHHRRGDSSKMWLLPDGSSIESRSDAEALGQMCCQQHRKTWSWAVFDETNETIGAVIFNFQIYATPDRATGYPLHSSLKYSIPAGREQTVRKAFYDAPARYKNPQSTESFRSAPDWWKTGRRIGFSDKLCEIAESLVGGIASSAGLERQFSTLGMT